MNNFKTNLKYSLKTRLNKKYLIYVISLFALIFVIGNVIPLIGKLVGDSPDPIVYVYSSNDKISSSVVDSLNDEEFGYDFKKTDDESSDVLNTDEEQYLINIDNNTVKGTSESSASSDVIFKQIFTSIDLNKLAINLNLSEKQIGAISNVGNFEYEQIKDSNYNSVDSSYDAYYVINLVVSIFAYIIIILGINYIGSDIVEEKSSRAMEIIVTSTNPVSHFFAKVLAIIIYLILLILPVFISIIITIFATSKIYDYDISIISEIFNQIFDGLDVSQFIVYVIIMLLLFFITLIIFLSLMGVLASTVSNSEEYQKISTPVTFFLVLPYILIYLPFLPDALFKYLGLVPGFALFVTPKLYLDSKISLAFVILIVLVQFIYLLIILKYGTKIYREGVLNYSDRKLIKVLRDAFRN